MAGGKVSEWIRKRTMPRRKKARSWSSVSEPILEEEVTGSGSGSGTSAPMPRKAARGGAAPAPSRSKLSAALRWRPRVNVLAVLYEKVVYHLLWLVESVVVVARLCFFLMRFGFKQL